MPHPVDHADLVARALGALSGEALARVDEALAADAALRQAFEEVAAHLLVYDRLPPAPPAPPFAQIHAALDAEPTIAAGASAAPDLRVLGLQTRQRVPSRQRFIGIAAAALLLGLLLWRPWQSDAPPRLTIVPGAGIELVRGGEALPAPAHGERTVLPGDVLHAREPAEVRLAGRTRIVLDADARLRIEGPSAVALEAGRAWFEVAPGTFVVHTAYGPVRVLGTAFEVDVRTEDLLVGVDHGVVSVGGVVSIGGTPAPGEPTIVRAGQRLAQGRVRAAALAAGAWFPRPRLRVHAERAEVGGVLRLTVILENASQVPVTLRGPSEIRTALWLHLADADGRPVRELPILAANLRAGADLLTPGSNHSLAPGAKKILTVEIPAPFASAGPYLCRALYRPAGRPGLLSDALRIEVR